MNTVTVESKGKFSALDITYVAMFSALMMIGANITSFLPFMVIGGVPITLQAFFAVLAGAFLGSRLGAISMAVYAFIGIVGAPVFAQFKGGFAQILNPTFGYILAFILTAYVTGKIIEKNNKFYAYVIATIVGVLIDYAIGPNWMYVAYKLWAEAPEAFSYKVVWIWNAVPFPKDIVLAVLAAIFAHRMRHIVKRKGTSA